MDAPDESSNWNSAVSHADLGGVGSASGLGRVMRRVISRAGRPFLRGQSEFNRDALALIVEVRNVGFSCVHLPGQSSERSSLSVPVRAGGDTLAALSVRFARSAVTEHVIRERFLPALRQAAHRMVDCFNRNSPKSSSAHARQTALITSEI